MMASLYHRSLATLVGTSICGNTFTEQLSAFTTEQQGRVIRRIDGQPHAAPFDHMPLAAHQIDDGADRADVVAASDRDIAEVEPECARTVAVQCNRHRHRVA